MPNFLYRLLSIPLFYQVSQKLLAPAADRLLTKNISGVLEKLPLAIKILDVGCGPSSWLWRVNRYPLGLDVSYDYVKKFRALGETSVTGSAFELPFKEAAFDGAWNFGLFHHLTDAEVSATVKEMIRVTREGGYIVIFDGVMPRNKFSRPIAWVLRKLDRGQFMRRQEHIESLLSKFRQWDIKRVTYSYLGHEGVFFSCIR